VLGGRVVDADHALELAQRQVVELPVARGHPGVVHGEVEPAVRRDCGLDGRLHGVLIRDIDGDGQRFPALFPDHLNGFGRREIVEAEHSHRSPAIDPARCPGWADRRKRSSRG
jgi:hypothetical protein